jgi:dynein heavy chain
VQKEEKWVIVIYESIADRLATALQPMTDYLNKFSKYNEFVNLNVDQYINEFASLDISLDDIRKEISAQISNKEKVESEIPKSVWLGLVQVNCDDIRRKLSMKCAEIIQKELDYFARLTKNKCEEINKNFKKIESELKRQPVDIQELTKLKEYMATIPLTVASTRDAIQDAMDSFDLLESFNYRLSKDMFKFKWTTFSWPKTIDDQQALKELNLQSDRQVFLNEMRQQQEEFMAELHEVEKKVNTFGQFNDIEKVEKTTEKCQKIHEKLEDLQSRARAFNNNENLFNLLTTDYRAVQKVVKNFEPYHQMWTTVNDWLKNHKSWKEDSFLALNGDDIATLVATYNKTLAKCLKSKTIKDNSGCFSIANNIKREVEAFKPHLPLIIALRNPGMHSSIGDSYYGESVLLW